MGHIGKLAQFLLAILNICHSEESTCILLLLLTPFVANHLSRDVQLIYDIVKIFRLARPVILG
jgi:hypothetical protein